MAGVVHIPWYATVFRADRVAAILQEVAPIAFKYGATKVQVHQNRDDRYRFDHMVWFESRMAFDIFWEGPEMVRFRARYSGWYQVPLLYTWFEELVSLEAEPEAAAEAAVAPPASAEGTAAA